MYGYIYLIVNNANGKTYVGQKKSYKTKSWNEDGYMGSGVWLANAKKLVRDAFYNREDKNITWNQFQRLYKETK